MCPFLEAEPEMKEHDFVPTQVTQVKMAQVVASSLSGFPEPFLGACRGLDGRGSE